MGEEFLGLGPPGAGGWTDMVRNGWNDPPATGYGRGS